MSEVRDAGREWEALSPDETGTVLARIHRTFPEWPFSDAPIRLNASRGMAPLAPWRLLWVQEKHAPARNAYLLETPAELFPLHPARVETTALQERIDSLLRATFGTFSPPQSRAWERFCALRETTASLPATVRMDRTSPVPWVTAWRTPEEGEKAWILGGIGAYTVCTLPLHDRVPLLRTFVLPFLKGECLLCEVLVPEVPEARPWDGYRRGHVVVDPRAGTVHALDGRSRSIYRINEQYGFRLEADVLECYLRYFCWALQAEEGRYWVLEHEHPQRDALFPVHAGQGALARWLDMLRRAMPERATTFVAGDPRMVRLVRYGADLFLAEFEIDPDGGVRMVDDHALLTDEGLHLHQETDPAADDSLFHFRKRHPEDRRYPADPLAPRNEAHVPAAPGGMLRDWLSQAQRTVSGLWIGDRCCTEPIHARAGTRLEDRLVVESVHFHAPVCLAGVRATAGIEFHHCRFEQGLDLRGIESDGDLIVRGCTVKSAAQREGEVPTVFALEQARITGHLRLERNLVIGRLGLQGIRVAGDLRLQGTRIQRCEEMFPERTLDRSTLFDQERDRSPIVIPPDNCYSRYDVPFERPALDLRGAMIEGRLDAAPALSAHRGVWEQSERVRDVLFVAGLIDMESLEARGDVRLGGLFCTGRLQARGVHTAGCLDAGACVVSFHSPPQVLVADAGVDLQGVEIGGGLSLAGAFCGDDLMLSFASIRGMFEARRYALRIAGDLILSAARIGFVELEALRANGRVQAITGEFGRFRLSTGMVHTHTRVLPMAGRVEHDYWIRPSRARALELRSVTVQTDMRCEGLRLENAEGATGGFELCDSRIGGSLLLFHPRVVRSVLGRLEPRDVPNSWAPTANDESLRIDPLGGGEEPSWLHGLEQRMPDTAFGARVHDLHITNTTIGGELCLQHVRAEGKGGFAGETAGDIRLRATEVGRDLNLSAYRRGTEARGMPEFRSRCMRMHLEHVAVGGDADLSGLAVCCIQDLSSGTAHGSSGWLSMRGLRVGGRLMLDHGKRSLPAPVEDHAFVARGIDLSASEVAHLVMSGRVFGVDTDDTPPGRRHSACQLALEGSRLENLEMRSPFPCRLDLGNAKVGRWNGFPPAKLRALLARTDFVRQTYLDAEQYLRNEGHDRLAAQVYRDMRRRAARHNRKEGRWMRAFWNRFIGLTTGYWTQPWRPVFLVVPFLLLSLWIFSNPGNVVGVTGVLEVQGATGQSGTREQDFWSRLEQSPLLMEARWSLQDATGMTLRYSVPIIDLFPPERWVPGHSPARLLRFWEPACRPPWLHREDTGRGHAEDCLLVELPITTESYALFVAILHWIIWPLFLLGVSGLVRRQGG